MKLLAADVGNTNVTLGLFTDGELVGSWRATTHAGATPDEVAAMTAEMLALEGHGLDELQAVALASVVPPLTDTFELFVRAASAGADDRGCRLAGRHAAHRDRSARRGRRGSPLQRAGSAPEFGGPAIVTTWGRAQLRPAETRKARNIGGAIAPGLGLSLEALVAPPASCPGSSCAPPHAIGSNPSTRCRAHGLGYIGLVSGPSPRCAASCWSAPRPRAGHRHSDRGYTHEQWLRDVPGIDAIEPELDPARDPLAYEAIRLAEGAASGSSSHGAWSRAMTEDSAAARRRRVVVGVAGSIAAYKAVSLVRMLAERGAVVDVAMTPARPSS